MKKSGREKLHILIMLSLMMISVMSVLVTARYMLRQQYTSLMDGDFFKGNGLWLKLLSFAAGLCKKDVIVFCHTIFPFVMLILVVAAELLLGYMMFSKDGRGKVYTLAMTFIFISIYHVILHVGFFPGALLESALYFESWQGYVMAGMVLLPLLTALLICKFSRTKKIVAGIVLFVLYFVCCGFDAWKELIFERKEISPFCGGWLLILAGIGIFIMVSLKNKMAGILMAVALISIALLLPLPAGLISAYFLSELISEVYKNRRYVLAGITYGIIVCVVLAAGFSSGSRTSWNIRFAPIENDIRIPQDVVEAVDFIVGEYGEDVKICGAYSTASEVEMLSVYKYDGRISARGLWEEKPLEIHDTEEGLQEIGEDEILILYGTNEEDYRTLCEKKLWLKKSFGAYNVFGR